MKRILVVFSIILFASTIIADNAFAQRRNLGNSNFKGKGLESLNLTDSQEEQIEKMRIDNRKEMIDLRANLQKAEVELREIKLKKDFTRDEYVSAVEKINDAKNQIALARANHRMDVYNILDDNQKEQWLEMSDRFYHKRFMMGDKKMYGRMHNRF